MGIMAPHVELLRCQIDYYNIQPHIVKLRAHMRKGGAASQMEGQIKALAAQLVAGGARLASTTAHAHARPAARLLTPSPNPLAAPPTAARAALAPCAARRRFW
jgi:hypothetical protein